MHITPLNEIEYNLEIMSKTCAQGKAKDIDVGFFAIFAADVEALKQPKLTSALLQKLDQLAVCICEAHLEAIELDKKSQHVSAEKAAGVRAKTVLGQPLSIQKFMTGYKPEVARASMDPADITRGLEMLDKDFLMEPIKPDGHCLFRAIGTRFLRNWASMPKEEQETRGNALIERVEALKRGSLFEKFIEVQTELRYLSRNPAKLDEVIYDDVRSNKVVAFLREFACEYNRQHTKDFAKKLPGYSEKSVDTYLREMSDMKGKIWGCPLETLALAKGLDSNICVIDVERLGKFGMRSVSRYKAHEGADDIQLIFRVNHYDLARAKKAPDSDP